MAAAATPPQPCIAAEAALEALAAELVRHYRAVGGGVVPPAQIEAIGLRLGQALAERYTQDRARMTEQLDVIKWACKELWGEVFHKQVDSLRTNHRGTFVLKDNQFRWTRALSADPVDGSSSGGGGVTSPAAQDAAAAHLLLPCALVRGALQALGVDCTVTADPAHLPAVDFTIVTRQAR